MYSQYIILSKYVKKIDFLKSEHKTRSLIETHHKYKICWIQYLIFNRSSSTLSCLCAAAVSRGKSVLETKKATCVHAVYSFAAQKENCWSSSGELEERKNNYIYLILAQRRIWYYINIKNYKINEEVKYEKTKQIQ